MDAYGFAVRPQHLQRYREYAKIYKEEEGERSERWKKFLEMCVATQIQSKESSAEVTVFESKEESANGTRENHVELDGSEESSSKDVAADTSESPKKEISVRKHEMWAEIRPSLSAIDHLMSFRVKKKTTSSNSEHGVARRSGSRKHLDSIQEGSTRKEEGSDEELQETERSDEAQEQPLNNCESDDASPSTTSQEPFFPWKEELESLVRGGVPMALRGEVWQSFVGVRTRRVEGYYQNLLSSEANASNNKETKGSFSNDHENLPKKPAKWKTQIEKDLPRTFPGHPALDEDGRDALRRLLTAYALHNPYVGYCQAMNFFAGLLLLLMPEENAFWTLIGIIDDYFEGYYSEEMIECQVDQLVFEELVRERFPKLVNHLDYLGVQVAWVTGAWFLSIFMNMLPWESVLRVWDVLLFDGNRLMLFRTALALLELYGPALVTTKDAGDAITLLQSLAGSTFDSSQLVLIASMGYQAVTETRLQDLRNKHRPDVLVTMEERSQGLASKDSKGLASKLYSFKHDPASALPDSNSNGGRSDMHTNGDVHPLESGVTNFDGFFNGQIDAEVDSVPDLQEQVTWLKVELCRLLEEKRSAILRAEELETALMEMVKQDNRRILTAKVEQLKLEVSELRQSLSDKQEQERAMLEVLMRVEQEQKVTEDARISAEQEAAAQKYAAHVLQEKYEESLILYAQMEKRAVMAETMLEATIQYQSGQHKAQQSVPPSPSPSPSTPRQESSQNASSQDTPKRRVGLLARPFVLGWLDKSKNKAGSSEDSSAGRNSNGWEEIPTPGKDIPGVQTPGEDLPGKDISGVQTPGKDLPGVQTPGKDLPGVETPRKDINDEQMVDK